ncbi:MAG: DUF2007 domain-containing protein [Dysgonamonadaceae bacterium]|jgi:hypothetical protein|nr:DUF2007 domain-containing protein [Dysgonamonadaceae bacterium]
MESEKLVDIAVFTFPIQAGVVESILSSENIQFVLNNQNGSIIAPGSGARLSVKNEDKERAIHIIREAGFEYYLLDAE